MGAAAGDFFTKIVTPHYKHLKAAAKKNGEDVFKVVAEEQRFYDRVACIIARTNAVLVRTAEMPGRGESAVRDGNDDLRGMDEERESYAEGMGFGTGAWADGLRLSPGEWSEA